MRITERQLRRFIRESVLLEADNPDKAYVPHDIFKLIKYGIKAQGGFVDNYFIAAAAMAYDRKEYDRMIRFLIVSHPYLASAAREGMENDAPWKVTLTKDQLEVLAEDRRIIRSWLYMTVPGSGATQAFDKYVADAKNLALPSVKLTEEEDAAIYEFLDEQGLLNQESSKIKRSVNKMTGKVVTIRPSYLSQNVLYKNLLLPFDITSDELWLYVSGNKNEIPEARRARISQYLDDFLFTVGFFPPVATEAFVATVTKLILEKRWDDLKALAAFSAGIVAVGGLASLAIGRLTRGASPAITETTINLGALTAEGKQQAETAIDVFRDGLQKTENLAVPEALAALDEAKAAIRSGTQIDAGAQADVADVAKKIHNAVIVQKPVVLPPEMRTGQDWLDTLIATVPKRELASDEEFMKNVFRPLRDEVVATAEKLKADPSDAASRARLEELWAQISKYAKPAFEGSPEDIAKLQGRAKSTMSSATFGRTAKNLYGKLGIDVNIIPIVGAQESVFAKYLTKYPRIILPPGGERPLATRVVVTPADEGKAILDSVRGVTSAGDEALVNTQGIGSDKISIVPITNSAGMDSMPTPWMISHAIFDSAAGNLLIDQGLMPRTKALVSAVESAYDSVVTKLVKLRSLTELPKFASEWESAGDRLTKRQFIKLLNKASPEEERQAITAYYLNDWRYKYDMESPIGLTVDSLWGRNAREAAAQIGAADREAVDLILDLRRNVDNQILTPIDINYAEPELDSKIAKHLGKTLEELPSFLDNTFRRYFNSPAPAVGARFKGLGAEGELAGTKQGVSSIVNYVERGKTDHIAEIMTSAITKAEGYVPKFDHLTDLVQAQYGEEGIQAVKETAAQIESILGVGGANAKAAFAEDLKGKVLFVFPD